MITEEGFNSVKNYDYPISEWLLFSATDCLFNIDVIIERIFMLNKIQLCWIYLGISQQM